MIRLICEIKLGDCAESDREMVKLEFRRRFGEAMHREFLREDYRIKAESAYPITSNSERVT